VETVESGRQAGQPAGHRHLSAIGDEVHRAKSGTVDILHDGVREPAVGGVGLSDAGRANDSADRGAQDPENSDGSGHANLTHGTSLI
jgi:hypothetical protein